jgi:hypothetical protein
MKFHLTYAALFDGELRHDYLLAAARDWASSRCGLREYVIAHELHPTPAEAQRDHHFHIYLKFGKRVDITDRFHSTIFDLRGQDDRVLHPEIQSVLPTAGDRERVINYDLKDGDYIAELETPLVNDVRRDAAEAEAREAAAAEDNDDGDGDGNGDAAPAPPSTPAWACMLNKATDVREGMELLAESAPHIYYLHGTRIKPMLTERVGVREPKLFTMADFNRLPLDLDEPIVLWGATGVGKTEFALAHFERPLVVRRRDDLKRATAHDGILFDDVDFSSWTPEDAICLLSQDKPRSLPARFCDAFVEADIPLIFTTNRAPDDIFPRSSCSEQRAAIKRRYVDIEVRSSLARLGRPLSRMEKRARREAGRNGPQGPAADAAEAGLFGP